MKNKTKFIPQIFLLVAAVLFIVFGVNPPTLFTLDLVAGFAIITLLTPPRLLR